MDPVAFEFGPLTIHWYGVLFALGFVLGLWTASRRAQRDGLAPEVILDLGPWLILGGIIGARFLYVVTYWDEQFAGEAFKEVFMVQKGGLVFYGGFVGAVIASVLYLRWKRQDLWKIADALAPSVALGHVFGRTGCLFNGCCYGTPTDLPWAIHFSEWHASGGAGVHPTQVYEAALNVALYAGLAWLHRHRQFRGQVFAVYLLGYAVLRGVVEVFRGDYTGEGPGVLSPGQAFGIPIVVAGGLLYFFRWRAHQEAARG